MSGKWHLGFSKWESTPTFRGFDSFLGFYSGGEDYFTHQTSGAYDFRRDGTPRCGRNCSEIDSADEGVYSTTVFTREAIRVIGSHDPSSPLFLYLAYQGVHAPAEVPQSYVDPYNKTIPDPKRRTFAGMLSAVDEGIQNVTQALKQKGMLEETLIVFTSDNGGPIYGGDAVGARNWPLRGGKHSIWEGGVRATAFITGHGIADAVKGTEYNSLMHGADWLPTLSSVAGYPLTGTLPLDGVSQWGQISGSEDRATPPRSGLVLGNSTNLCSWPVGDPRRSRYETAAAVQDAKLGCGFGIREGPWKLVQGYGGTPDWWCNTSKAGDKKHCRALPQMRHDCPEGWCLFNVEKDPWELDECSKTHQTVAKQLQDRMSSMLQSYTQYEEDKACPPVSYATDPKVGKTWEPWC